jgi:hypothetical protein
MLQRNADSCHKLAEKAPGATGAAAILRVQGAALHALFTCVTVGQLVICWTTERQYLGVDIMLILLGADPR